MIYRNITQHILEALTDSPVVLLHGARQTGKSTLVQWLVSEPHAARYLTLDDAGVLAAARDDPAGFLAGLQGPVALDEVQRAPELFLAIKTEVDRARQPGRFLLTGSADVFLLPHLAESLAGRMEILRLWPLSQGEVAGVKEGFVEAIFDETLPPLVGPPIDRTALFGSILLGGYPEILQRPSEARRNAWFGSYITTILQRDVRDLANIEGLTALPRLLALLAARATSLLNFSELSRSSAIPQSTLKRYLTLLETTFLMQTLPAWSGNLGKRLVRSPKLVLSDTGLMAHLLGLNKDRLNLDMGMAGPVLENFVIMELRKQITWSQIQPHLLHFRTQSGQEVDLILESPSGYLVGIEVKARATVKARDFKGLRVVAEAFGDRFKRGVVLYTGSECIPFGSQLYAVPISALWRMGVENRGGWGLAPP